VIAAVLFDMDDTLYPEASYVRSGFRAVGRALAERGLADAAEAADVFIGIHFGEGRDRVFNKAAERIGFPEELVPTLVATYRDHEPEPLDFYDDVVDVLAALRPRYRLGVVTDGWLNVQGAKARALGVADHVDHVFLADQLGRARWKPHPEPFHRCLEALGAPDPAQAVFVGDNPERDVVGARNAGMHPVRIVRGDAYFGGADDADAAPVITSLTELPALLDTLESSS